MILKVLSDSFTVCKVEDFSLVNMNAEYCFVEKTDEEKSLVCLTADVPSNVIERDDGWKGFRIQGVLDFSLIGILSKISTILAKEGISIFAVSTYNTDYVLLKEENYQKALDILEQSGYSITA
ncbi:MAG: ACT domain-containing protein [Clostridiales bacterium]|nr:ACT domain-containing protein [Clostridiales bacterium]